MKRKTIENAIKHGGKFILCKVFAGVLAFVLVMVEKSSAASILILSTTLLVVLIMEIFQVFKILEVLFND